MIYNTDVKVISYNKNLFQNDNSVDKIIKHTENTWQEKRKLEEKTKDTLLGKIAESVVEEYIEKHIPNITYVSYDSFRQDGFLKHAPFDGLLFHKETNSDIIEDIKQKINYEVKNNKYGKISFKLKLECLKNHIYITEIKSTRITDRHKNNNLIDLNKILEDDFLEYPTFLRTDKTNKIKTVEDYLNFINSKQKNHISIEDLKLVEKNNMRHIYIRTYVDEENNNCYIIGCISSKTFLNNFKIKHMPQKNKSENAIFLSTSLRNGSSIDILSKIIPKVFKEEKTQNLNNKIKI